MTTNKNLLILEHSGYRMIAEGPIVKKYAPEKFEHTFTVFNMRVEDSKGNLITPIINEIEVVYFFEISAKVNFFQGFSIINHEIYFETHENNHEDYHFYKIISGVGEVCNTINFRKHLQEVQFLNANDPLVFSEYILNHYFKSKKEQK
jgi:hypothetical protein